MRTIIIEIKILLSKIQRFFYWGWKLRNNADYDFAHFEWMMLLKLKRMKDYFKGSDICDWTSPNPEEDKTSMKALNLAIKILERLTTRDSVLYCDNLYRKIEAKWGGYETMNLRIKMVRANVITDEDVKEYRKDFQNAWDTSAKIYRRDNRNFYRILEKYGRHWWD